MSLCHAPEKKGHTKGTRGPNEAGGMWAEPLATSSLSKSRWQSLDSLGLLPHPEGQEESCPSQGQSCRKLSLRRETRVLPRARRYSLLRASSQRSPGQFLPFPLWSHSAGGPPSSLDPRGQAWPIGAWQIPRICQAVGRAALGPLGSGGQARSLGCWCPLGEGGNCKREASREGERDCTLSDKQA